MPTVTLRTSLARPLTHTELDNNFLSLEIPRWVVNDYSAGQYVIHTDNDATTNLYHCENSHAGAVYTGGTFSTTYTNSNITTTLWLKIGSSGGGGGGADIYVTGGTSTAGTGGTVNIKEILNRNDNNSVTVDLLNAFTYTNTNAVKKTVGGINSGDTPFTSGKSLHQIVQSIFYPALPPVIIYTSLAFSTGQSSLLEIGTTITSLSLAATTTRGSSVISPQPTKYMGLPTQYAFSGLNSTTGTGLPTTNTTTSLSNTLTVSNYSVVQGSNNNTFQVIMSYSAGNTPVYDDGSTYTDATFTNSGTKTSTASFEGVYAIYATTVGITTQTKQTLYSMLTGNNIQFTLIAEADVTNRQTFWLPVAWTSGRPLTAVNYYNTVSSSFDSTNKISDFTTTSTTIGGVSYTVYTYNGTQRGNQLIKIIF